MIHVCFGLHDKTGRYSKFTGTAMLSLLDNTNAKVTVHILHDNTLTLDNRDKFSYVAGQYNQRVEFHNVEEFCADKIAEYVALIPNAKSSPVGIGAFYRMLISEVLSKSIEKIVYLDSDTIVNLDVKELWQIELNDKILACIPEAKNGVDTQKNLPLCYEGYVEPEDYFNSGVLLINLKQFRNEEELLKRGIKFRGEHLYYFCFDQDILNYCFSARTLKLSNKFNFFVREARLRSESTKIDKKIYHYLSSSGGKGILLNFRDPFNRLWLKYFVKTPWFDEETIGRLYAGVQILHVGFKQSMANLTAIMSGKTRGFFVAPPNVDAFKKLFSVRDDEEIITADSQESLIKLLESMKRNHGKKLFFIMLPNFPFQILTQAGFAPGKDFVNGLEFLSEAQGVPLNSWPLVQAM